MDAVKVHLVKEAALAPASLAQLQEALTRFSRFIQRGLGIADARSIRPEHARAFVTAIRADGSPPPISTMHVRRRAIRTAFRIGRELGLLTPDRDPTLDLLLPSRAKTPTRPLTDSELARGRASAEDGLFSTCRPVGWAMCEATALTDELWQLSVGDVDLESGRVRLPGTGRIDPRHGTLTTWGRDQVERRVRMLGPAPDPQALVLDWRRPPKNPRAAAGQLVSSTLRAAGLRGPGVHPRSIPAWAGASALARGASVAAVARILGIRSLDETARFIAYEWRAGEDGR